MSDLLRAQRRAFHPDFMYRDPANPTFSTRWGFGNDPLTKRTILAPQHKRVIIDGTTPTVTNGNYVHVFDIAAAKALAFTPGDWWLLPGGATSGPIAELNDNSLSGFRGNSLSDLACFGTFDPANKEVDARYNVMQHTIDISGLGRQAQAMTCSRAGGFKFMTMQAMKFLATDVDVGANIFLGGQANMSDVLLEACDLDHVFANIQGQPYPGGAFTSLASSATLNDVTWKLSTFSDANAELGGRAGNVYGEMQRRYRFERCLNYHAGWARGMTRATPAWSGRGTQVSIVSITSVGTLATVTCAAPHGLSTGQMAEIASTIASPYVVYTLGSLVRLDATHFTYTFAGNGNVPAPGTLSMYHMSELGWTYAVGDGPDYYKHDAYIADETDDTQLLDCMFGHSSSWPKLTGGNHRNQNMVVIRSPGSWFAAAIANNPLAWPAGSTHKSDNLLQLGSCDIGTFPGNLHPSGQGPNYVAGLVAGSYLHGAIMVNQGGTNQAGVVADAQGYAPHVDLEVDSCVMANWCAQDQSGSIANTSKRYTNCKWDDASSGTNQSWADLTPAERARKDAMLALSINGSFCAEQGITVSQSGSVDDIELRVMDYMRDHWREQDWVAAVQNHWRHTLAGV